MENPKEKFLEKYNKDNNGEITQNIDLNNNNENKIVLKAQIPNQENLGMICSIISNFFIAFGTFWTKIVQINYPNDFKTIQFLFLRSISIIFFALFHTYITKVPLLNPLKMNLKFWFFIRTNVNFFGVCSFTLSLWYLRSSTAQIIFSLSPIVVFFLSYIILQEKLYMRYAYGTIICIIGSIFIISNESILQEKKIKLSKI